MLHKIPKLRRSLVSDGINVAESIKFIQGFYNRMAGFKASTEENLIREKKRKVLLYYKNTRISYWLYDT
jgi:hypothetical protein